MIRTRWTLTFIFAMACCLVLILTPVSGSAQGIGGTVKHGVQKGAGAVQKGVEGAAEETKKGAEAAGRGVKKAVTGEDKEGVTQERTTGTETTSRTRTRATVQTRRREPGEKNLPGTAGELPLLAFAGASCLAGLGARKLAWRKKS